MPELIAAKSFLIVYAVGIGVVALACLAFALLVRLCKAHPLTRRVQALYDHADHEGDPHE